MTLIELRDTLTEILNDKRTLHDDYPVIVLDDEGAANKIRWVYLQDGRLIIDLYTKEANHAFC